MNVELVGVQNVDNVWPLVADYLVKSRKKTPSYPTVGEIWSACRSGSAFLFVAYDEAGVKGVSAWRFDGNKFVCLGLAGRDMNSWGEVMMHGPVLDVARSGGAVTIAATGRVGLVRQIRKLFPKMEIVRYTFEVEI